MATSLLQVSADGYLPQEVEFIVVDSHPTLLNVTLHSAKVGDVISNFVTNVLFRILYIAQIT